MKIDKIHYYNFRNFDKEGEITFNTDGKVTIIYGTNGDGKTTLHQLLQKQNDLGDWKELEDPEALIEEVLPSGLAPYFFFDGETMIADLKIRGMDSAKTLKKALHSIFELEVYENALKDIGTIKNAQSALGQLHRKKLDAFEKVTKEKI